MRVFLSSTKQDLSEERDAVHEALSAEHEVVRMEDFGSRGARALETCLDEVERCDALVLLLGHRYGTLAPRHGMSYTEAEYERARECDLEVIAYVREGIAAAIDSADDPARLSDFYETLKDAHTIHHPLFDDAIELAERAMNDVRRWAQRQRRPKFRRRAGPIADRLSYSVGGARHRRLQLRPFPIVLVELPVLGERSYSAARGRRLKRKMLELRQSLISSGTTVVIFNEIPAPDPELGSVVEQRAREVNEHAAAIVCFVKGQVDVPHLSYFEDATGRVAVWYPERLNEIETPDGAYTETYTDDELQSCDVSAAAQDYLDYLIDQHLLPPRESP